MDTWPENWMGEAYSLVWLVVVVLSCAIMVVLYSRVVYTLWFNPNGVNQLSCQQRVGINEVVLIYLKNMFLIYFCALRCFFLYSLPTIKQKSLALLITMVQLWDVGVIKSE